MEGRGRGRGRGEGGGRGRGGDRGGRGGGDRGGFSGRGRGQQQQRDDPSRGPQFPGSRGDGGSGGHYDRGSDQGSRQREGDWTCSSCGFNNFAKNYDCYRCKTNKSGAGGGGGGRSEGRSDGGYQRGGGRSDGGYQRGGGHGDGGYQRGGGRSEGGYQQGGGRSEGGYQQGGGRSEGGYQQGGGRSDGGYQRGGGRGEGGYQRGGGRGRGGDRGRGGQGGGRGGEIDWAAQEEMETSSQSSTYSDPAAAELAAKMEKMKLNDLPPELAREDKNKYSVIPRRINQGPTVGTRGRQIMIEVNHVQLTFDPKKKLAIHYDCAFEPDKLSRKVLRRIMNIVRDRNYPRRSPAFDGKKNLYSCGEMPLFEGPQLQETVELPPEEGSSKPLRVKVTIKEVEGESRIDLTLINKYLQRQITEYPQKPVQVMEIVLRNAPASAGFTQVGRSFFTPPPRPITLGHGMELYHGFFQSVVLGWKTFLNVDVAHKGFPEARDVAEIMCEFKNTGRNPKPYPGDMKFTTEELENFKKFIKGTRVAYAIPGIPTSRRKFTAIGVKPPANVLKFEFKRNENDRGEQITVQDYLSREKRYKLKYPHLPCLHVGDPKKNTFIPPELCRVVVGQVMMKKLDPEQTRAMIKEAAQPPSDRKDKIMNAMRNANFMQDNCVQEFGVNVGQQFTRVPARILSTPTIEYGNRTSDPANGEWRVQEFKQAKTLNKWAIASASSFCGINDLRQIIDRFKGVCREVGMSVSEPYRTDHLVQNRWISDDDLNRTLLQTFREYKKDQVQIVVMLIPDKAYCKVKLIAETQVGLLTQCILEKTMKRMDASTGKNLLLKINAKLDGVNHTVIRNVREKLKSDRVMELLQGTMLMGADVTHPSPDQKEIPSVAAVTASHDPYSFKYNMVWRLQPPKQEIIGDLYNITITQLRYYKAKNGRVPDRIIFYRDGVSEGQFIQVLQVEMTCIKCACLKELGKDLPVTFLVVQKRHHTRFFPTAKDHMDRKGNVPPGTVVDTTITHPTEADFYMVSHASLQGTSRPTKYHKLWDDSNINEDDLEELTFFLCHMFSRCTRSVSYPAPTYYAHLGAARGKVYLEGSKIDIKQLAMEMQRRTIHNSIINESPMFFT